MIGPGHTTRTTRSRSVSVAPCFASIPLSKVDRDLRVNPRTAFDANVGIGIGVSTDRVRAIGIGFGVTECGGCCCKKIHDGFWICNPHAFISSSFPSLFAASSVECARIYIYLLLRVRASPMGLRSRDALARANSIVNERNARAGRVRRKTTTTTTTTTMGASSASASSGNKATTESTGTTTGKRRLGMHGLLNHGRRKKIRWPDMDNSTREVTASGREVDVERGAEDVEDEGPSSSNPNDGGGEQISTKPRLRQSLETTIEYTPSASEDSTHDDALRAFNRLSSVGAGAYVRGYDDSSDEDSLSDEHDRAMRRAIHELEFANQGDSCSCCVVM